MKNENLAKLPKISDKDGLKNFLKKQTEKDREIFDKIDDSSFLDLFAKKIKIASNSYVSFIDIHQITVETYKELKELFEKSLEKQHN